MILRLHSVSWGDPVGVEHDVDCWTCISADAYISHIAHLLAVVGRAVVTALCENAVVTASKRVQKHDCSGMQIHAWFRPDLASMASSSEANCGR